jgi:hypothetical protein
MDKYRKVLKRAFKSVVLSENHTLCWPNITQSFSYKGKISTEPLELDAQELYGLSQKWHRRNRWK